MNLPSRGSLLRKLLIIIPVVVGLILVGIFMPAQRLTIEGIGRLSFETTINLSVGSEVAYASHSIAKVGTDTSGTGTSLTLPFSLSFSHTLVAGSDRLVVVCVGVENGDTIDVSSVTYGGVAMTKAIDGIISSGIPTFHYLCEIWYILESDLPSDGANTVEIACSGTAYELEVNGFCAEYTGVEQVAPEATAEHGQTTGATITNTISPSDNAWVISAVGAGNAGSFTHGQGQVEVLDYADTSSTFAVAELRGASGETSLDSTFLGTLNRLERVAASFTEAPAAPPAAPTYQSFTEAKSGPDIGFPNNVTSITVNKPADTASGDLLIGVVVTDDEAGAFTPPAGWTPINSGTNGTVVTVGTWYKIAGGSEPASYQWSWTNPQTVYAFILRITGHDSSNPINVWGVDTGNSITPTCPDVTTTVADTLVLRIFGANWAQVTVDGGYPSGHTGITVDVSGDPTQMGQCSGGAAYKTQATAGATATAAFTMTGAHEWRALTVVIAPPAAPPDISNAPPSINFGIVSETSSYWSNGSAPTFPLDDGECLLTVTNNSSASVNIQIKATDFTGGVGWTLAGSPGANTVTLKAGKSGDNLETDMVILTTSDQSFISDLGASSSIEWEIKLETGTFTDGVQKTSTITLTATFA